MVVLHLHDGSLEVEVRGLHKVWAMKSRFEVPLSAITAIRRVPRDATRGLWKGWRAPGTHVPGLIIAGTYYKDRERHFWDVRHADRAIEIDLSTDDSFYDRLFVEVDDPDTTIAELERARLGAG